MKTLFIPVKSKAEINKEKINSLKLPKNLVIAYSIQFKEIAKEVMQILSKKHKVLRIVQVLGCSKLNLPKDVEAILLISSGRFHAISLAIETKKKVFVLENNSLIEIHQREVKNFEKKQKASYLRFLNEDKVGVLISTKPGQQRLDRALKFKSKGKKLYFFISNNIDVNEFENFGLKSWVNTACPRMDMNDSRIINIDKLWVRL